MLQILRTWMLAFALIMGAVLYFGWMALPFGPMYERQAIGVVSTVQPWLIFAMLFLTFCKINVRELRLKHWHIIGLLFQGVVFLLCALVLVGVPNPYDIVVQAAMLCFITPTATAAAVVVGKLKGDVTDVTAYTILSNLLAALLIPLVAPIVYPMGESEVWAASLRILARIFPLLIAPLLLAGVVRLFFKSLLHRLLALHDLAFYIWAVSLMLAITVSTRSIVESNAPFTLLLAIALVSLLACGAQFALGRTLRQEKTLSLTAGQALGQKNTVFLIWVGYTYFHPLSSIAGGFYSIYHNLWNSYQLSRKAAKPVK